jgi:hypothetical protein
MAERSESAFSWLRGYFLFGTTASFVAGRPSPNHSSEIAGCTLPTFAAIGPGQPALPWSSSPQVSKEVASDRRTH